MQISNRITNLSNIDELQNIENRSLKIIDFDAHKFETRERHQTVPLTQRLEYYLFLLTFFKLIPVFSLKNGIVLHS